MMEMRYVLLGEISIVMLDEQRQAVTFFREINFANVRLRKINNLRDSSLYKYDWLTRNDDVTVERFVICPIVSLG